jgi:uncharacterized protein YqgC (DUF456 family)
LGQEALEAVLAVLVARAGLVEPALPALALLAHKRFKPQKW